MTLPVDHAMGSADHALIIGASGSGKTTLAADLATAWRRRGGQLAVLDPFKDERWPTARISDDRESFFDAAQNEWQHMALFIDEGRDMLNRDPRFDWYARASRHRHLRCYFIGQRYADYTPAIRDNTPHLFLFNCHSSFAEQAAREFNDDELATANTLRRGYFLYKTRHKPLIRGKVHWAE